MYGLPEEFDASRLVGCVLEQVSFSVNTMHLSFSNDVSITIESCFAHSTYRDLSSAKRIRIPVRQSSVMQLLGESITSAHATSDGTLILKFANGQALACFDDTSQYEAYRIMLGKEEIVV